MSELAAAVFAAETGAHLVDEPRSLRFERFRSGFDEQTCRAQLAAAGLRFVGRRDPAFPSRLAAIHDPPLGLFVRGSASLDLLDRPSVAIVGARACSSYGTAVALGFGRELAAAGVLVISGLARGVDAAAHRGALDAGDTVAVLGCGIDRDYPRAHAGLARSIVERGLILSEYAPAVEARTVAVPGAQPHRRRARRRDGCGGGP